MKPEKDFYEDCLRRRLLHTRLYYILFVHSCSTPLERKKG